MSTTTTTAPTLEAIQFFYEHAGSSHDPETQTEDEGRREGAEALAKAEAWAKTAGVEFTWEDDWEISHKDFYGADSAYADGEPETCEMVSLSYEGDVLASLCCIDDATDEYRRVVEAELAAEAFQGLYGPVTTFLRSDADMSEGTLESVRAAIFGVLIGLTGNLVQHYRSDFYHDARWIRDHVAEPTVFFFGANESGTAIGTDEQLVRKSRTTVWQVEVTRSERGKWETTTTRLS